MLTNFQSKYRVECKIGEGSFSEVLKCQDKHTGVYVAAKYLKKSFKSIGHAAELPELIALRKLVRHPNILHMIESHFDTSTGRVTFVFELMDMSLYDLIKNRRKKYFRPIIESKAKCYLYQIVKGVGHIHHHGIFHRDIKPENILIKGELLKISDLGSVKGIYTRHPYTEYISTRWYRSPECLLTTGYYGPKMDVWAIGCVFFELLTLKPLFPGSSELDQISKINAVLGTPNPRLITKFRKHKCRNISVSFPVKTGSGLNQLVPFMSDGGRDIIKQMIVYDPDSRSNIRRLIEHKYFADVLENYSRITNSTRTQGSSQTNFTLKYRNPVLLSYLLEKKRRTKKKIINQVKASANTSNKLSLNEEPSAKITEAKRNALLQQKLQQKQHELQQRDRTIEKAQPSLAVKKSKFDLDLNISEISNVQLGLAAKVAENYNKKEQTLELLKEKLSKTHQAVDKGAGERLLFKS